MPCDMTSSKTRFWKVSLYQNVCHLIQNDLLLILPLQVRVHSLKNFFSKFYHTLLLVMSFFTLVRILQFFFFSSRDAGSSLHSISSSSLIIFSLNNNNGPLIFWDFLIFHPAISPPIFSNGLITLFRFTQFYRISCQKNRVQLYA